MLGAGTIKIYNLIKKLFSKNKKTGSAKKESAFCRFSEYYSAGIIMLLLLAGLSNAVSYFLKFPLDKAHKLFAIVLIVVLTICYFYVVVSKLMNFAKARLTAPAGNNTVNKATNITKKFRLLSLAAICIGLSQLIYSACSRTVLLGGDQVLEAVNSFIASNGIYTIDPLTGAPFTDGYPLRLALECLPFLYSFFAKLFGTEITILLWNIMPSFWLLAGYCCFYKLAGAIFSADDNKNHERRIFFLLLCEFLLFCTDAAKGSVGFDIFHAGYRPEVVLALVLVTWTLAVCLEHNWFLALLPIAAEPVTASPRFMVGACFFITLVCFILNLFLSRGRKGVTNGKA